MLALAWAGLVWGADSADYIDSARCATCHAEIAERFARSGMGVSVAPIASSANQADWSAGVFVHKRSRRSFQPSAQDGRYGLQRFQHNTQGQTENEIEREAHWIVGSGNHAQTFLNLARPGVWVELPLSWYSENGGSWGMSPGYDQPHHAGFRRVVDERCIFCHAAYPAPDEPNVLRPIDCQRCHGPGRRHVESFAAPEQSESTIVNPAKLGPDRALEVCLQCHLQSTSRPLPDAILRFGRSEYSFQPGEPLGAFRLTLDHAEGTPQHDKFEVNGAGYQMLRSACFQASGAAKLSCRTCHDPHGDDSAEAMRDAATATCRNCHIDLGPGHPPQGDCLDCHMPKRRTEDAVHVTMHDHSIPRVPSSSDWRAPIDELAAAQASAYSGEVVLFYPPDASSPETPLYLAMAQVRDGASLAAGATSLRGLLQDRTPQAEALFALAEAYRRLGDCTAAAPIYRQAREHGDTSAALEQVLGECLMRVGKTEEARVGLDLALAANPNHAGLSMTAGVAAGQVGEIERSLELLRQATTAAPERPLAWLNLGASLEAAGRLDEAEQVYRMAVNIQPDHALARTHLATLLLKQGRAQEGRHQLEQCLADNPRMAAAHLQLARLAADEDDLKAARRSYAEAVRWGSPQIRELAKTETAALAPDAPRR